MAFTSNQEGHLITRPPMFNGIDYTYWKTRMRIFLISMDLKLWNLMENGFQKSSLPMNNWNELEKKTFSLNAKAMNALFYALEKNKFNLISTCETLLTFGIHLKLHTKALLELKILKSIF